MCVAFSMLSAARFATAEHWIRPQSVQSDAAAAMERAHSDGDLAMDVEDTSVLRQTSDDEMFLDVECGGLDRLRMNEMRRHRAPACARWDRAGPSTLDELLAWPAQGLASLEEADAALESNMSAIARDKLMGGIVLTTSYSGLGTAECALSMVVEEFARQNPGMPCNVVFYSACDVAPEARQCLLAHGRQSRPRHVFGDLLDRLYPTDKEELDIIVDQCIRGWHRYLEGAQEGQRPKAEIMAEKKRLGSEMRGLLLAFLSEVEFRPDSFCYVHEQRCPLDPKDDWWLKDWFHIEVAGNTCTPWSTIGQLGGWLSPCTLPVAVWATHQRFLGTNAVVNECTPLWEAVVLNKEVFTNVSAEIPKSNRYKGSSRYYFQSLCFNSTDMGIPVSRERRWSLWFRADSPQLCHMPHFADIFFRSLACSSAVFLKASAELLAEDIMQRTEKLMNLGKEQLEGLGITHAESVFPPGQLARLQAWRHVAERKGIFDASTHTSRHYTSLIVDLTQNAEWSSVGLDVTIPLKRNSEPFDLIARRPLHILERLLIHGFPVPGLASEKDSRNFPFPHLLEEGRLRDADLKSLCGNGMVLQVVGCILLYVLGAETG